MSTPILRRNNHDQRDDSHRGNSFDDNAKTILGASPVVPPSTVDGKPWSKVLSEMFPLPTDISVHSQAVPPWKASHSFVTSVSAAATTYSAYSDQVSYTNTILPTFVSSNGVPVITSTYNGDDNNRDNSSPWGEKRLDPKIMAAVGVVISIVAMIVIGFIVFFCLRKRKAQKQIQATQARVQEMKSRSQPSTHAHMATSPTYTQYTPPLSHPPPAALATPQAQPPPVILGPIIPGSNGAYYTGIDTSDIVSVNDHTGLGNPFADGDGVNEEPPPPYRPRSFAPVSRNTSLQAPPAATSRTNLIGGQEQSLRSPFADPLDDDAISDISGPTLGGHHDGMSVVSDMSYQDDHPVMVRPTV